MSGSEDEPFFFRSDDFAVVLGLKKSIHNDGREPTNEVQRLSSLLNYLHCNRMQSEDQQEVVWSRFCALYLPATVDRYLDPPTLSNQPPELVEDFAFYNAYLEMLVAIQHSPYFAKYLLSSKTISAAGKRLPQAIAEQIVRLGPKWDRYLLSPPTSTVPYHHINALANVAQLLGTLFTLFVKEPDQNSVISFDTRRQLDPLMKKWAKRHSTEPLGRSCGVAWLVSSEYSRYNEDVLKVRRQYINWNVCGVPFCDVTTNLKVCSRCHTVRYCTPEHQRIHWQFLFGLPHKQTCYQTEY